MKTDWNMEARTRPLPVWQFAVVLVLCLTVFDTAGAGALERLFAPKAVPWSYWDTSSNSSSTLKVDHSRWDSFLKSYVQTDAAGINRVPYADVQADDRESLEKYIDELSKLPIRQFPRNEQLAYWINLYNALTVSLVLDHYPVASIRDIDISPGLFAMGPWGKKLLVIEGQEVSLNDIEHRILRPLWQDPRLHYILNCASLGCPNLHNRAFPAAATDDVMENAARTFINHPRGVTVRDGRLYVSSIYSWFQADFGDSEQAVIQHLEHYASGELADSLAGMTRIQDDHYDWTLNDADPAGVPPSDEKPDF
jgi:hypothetical protein